MAGPEQSMGYKDPAAGGPTLPGNHMGAAHAQPAAPIQLGFDQPIGIQPAQPPAQQDGGGRGAHFAKGMTEGLGGDAAEGGGEASGLLKMAAMFLK